MQMCVSLCNRFLKLYWNHSNCSPDFCSVVNDLHGSCQSCRHKSEDCCALTHASLPEAGCCCHWNIPWREETVQVTPAMVAPLAGYFDRVKNVLTDVPHEVYGEMWLITPEYTGRFDALGIEYQPEDEGLHIDPRQLVLVIDEPVTDILERLDVPCQIIGDSVWVDPADLSLPGVFGQGVE